MLNPEPITDAIVAALQDIPLVVAEMGGDPTRIQAFHYRPGQDLRLVERVYKMTPPEILVAFNQTLAGNFDGETIFKHRFEVYIRVGNLATMPDPHSFEYLWWALTSAKMNSTGQNIRYVNLVFGLEIMDTPSISHHVDEDGQDYFCAYFVFPEIGDN